MRDNISLILLILLILAVGYIIFFKPRESVTEEIFNARQDEIKQKVIVLEQKIDSLKKFRDTIKEHYSTIEYREQEKKDEVFNTNNVDSLINLFYKHFPDSAARFQNRKYGSVNAEASY